MFETLSMEEEFGGGDADIVRGYDLAFLCGGGDECAAGEVVNISEDASGGLVGGGNSLGFEESWVASCDFEMMGHVIGGLLFIARSEMHSGGDSGSQRSGRGVSQFIDQILLADQDHDSHGFGIVIELGEGMQFFEGFQGQERSLVDDQERGYFLCGNFFEGGDDGVMHSGAVSRQRDTQGHEYPAIGFDV